MAKTLVLTSKHDLGVEGAKRSISERYESLKRTYIDRFGSSELTWSGNVGHGWATSLGQKGHAVIEVGEHDLRIEITLPLLLTPLHGFLETMLRSNADALTGKS